MRKEWAKRTVRSGTAYNAARKYDCRRSKLQLNSESETKYVCEKNEKRIGLFVRCDIYVEKAFQAMKLMLYMNYRQQFIVASDKIRI